MINNIKLEGLYLTRMYTWNVSSFCKYLNKTQIQEENITKQVSEEEQNM